MCVLCVCVFQIEAQEQETSVADSLYKNVSSLEAIFHILDSDQSGKPKTITNMRPRMKSNNLLL